MTRTAEYIASNKLNCNFICLKKLYVMSCQTLIKMHKIKLAVKCFIVLKKSQKEQNVLL
jgi:hypothetical protein